MATDQKAEGTQDIDSSDAAVGFAGKVEAKYRELKEHAETYPYVWASYAVVYGGFGLWFAYRWRKLRRTEDRVRALQVRLRQLAEAEESTSSSRSPPLPTKADNPASSTSSSLPTKADNPPN